jgi:nitrite reductase/ring-hydroxylating ferredoxin subunit
MPGLPIIAASTRTRPPPIPRVLDLRQYSPVNNPDERTRPGIPVDARAALDELREGTCARLELADGSLIAVRRDGAVHCYLNRCPHQGTELDWLPGVLFDATGRYLQCATHGALFEPTTGLCIEGPCRGLSLLRITPSVV